MLINSLITLLVTYHLKILNSKFNFFFLTNYNEYTEVGLSPLLIGIIHYLYSFKVYTKAYITVIDAQFPINAFPFLIIFFLLIITPNKNLIGNSSSIITSILIKNILAKFLFPSGDNVLSLDYCFRNNYLYVSSQFIDEKFKKTFFEVSKAFWNKPIKQHIIQEGEQLQNINNLRNEDNNNLNSNDSNNENEMNSSRRDMEINN